MGVLDRESEEELEGFLSQSAQGIHILFENKTVAGILHRRGPIESIDEESQGRINQVFHKLVSCGSYLDKVAFLKDLDVETFELLVRYYFHLVENSVRASVKSFH